MKQFVPSRRSFRLFNILASFLLCFSATFYALYKLDYPLIGIDDANIYFVYARNLANGYGFVYNIGGERVEGFTSLLWTLISALAFKLSTFPELTLLAINIVLLSLGTVCALHFLQQSSSRMGDPWAVKLFWPVLFLVLLFSSPRYVIWNTISLMENALWSTLLLITTILIIQDDLSAQSIHFRFLPLAVLLLLTRPESFLWVGVFLAVLFIRLAFTGGILYALKTLTPSMIGILIVIILLTLFRLQYFGYPLPNTYYAKVSPSLTYNLRQGMEYLVTYMISEPIALVGVLTVILACDAAIFRNSPVKGEFYLPFLAATGLLLPLLTGGDHFGSFRFYQNVYPITILCLLYFARSQIPKVSGSKLIAGRLPNHRNILYSGFAVLLAAGFAISQTMIWSKFPSEMKSDYFIARYERLSGAFMHDLFSPLPRLPSVGVIAAGGFKYSYGGEVVDLVGLNNTLMAHNHGMRIGYKAHAAFEPETFYKLEPEIVSPFTVNDLWQYSQEGIKGNWDNQLAFKGLYDEPQFLALYQYAKICKASQSGCKLALVGWIRKDLMEELIQREDFRVEQYEYTP